MKAWKKIASLGMAASVGLFVLTERTRSISAAPIPAQDPTCCKCQILIDPQGHPYIGCPCNFTEGGTGCVISGTNCRTTGTCP